MKIRETISVWLVLKDGPNKGKIVLQKRAESEKHFPFVCQATWSGGVEDGEDVMDAIKRECREELGENFYNNFDFIKLNFLGKQNFFRESKGNVWECNHYLGKISSKNLNLIKLHSDASKLVFIDKNDDIYPLNSAKNPKENIVLFDDQYKILENILNEY
jgi:isopentenyldiphosphate isomerase